MSIDVSEAKRALTVEWDEALQRLDNNQQCLRALPFQLQRPADIARWPQLGYFLRRGFLSEPFCRENFAWR